MASLLKMRKVCYLGDKIRVGWGTFDSVITRIKSASCKFRDLVALLASRGLASGAKGRVYFVCGCSFML